MLVDFHKKLLSMDKSNRDFDWKEGNFAIHINFMHMLSNYCEITAARSVLYVG